MVCASVARPWPVRSRTRADGRPARVGVAPASRRRPRRRRPARIARAAAAAGRPSTGLASASERSTGPAGRPARWVGSRRPTPALPPGPGGSRPRGSGVGADAGLIPTGPDHWSSYVAGSPTRSCAVGVTGGTNCHDHRGSQVDGRPAPARRPTTPQSSVAPDGGDAASVAEPERPGSSGTPPGAGTVAAQVGLLPRRQRRRGPRRRIRPRRAAAACGAASRPRFHSGLSTCWSICGSSSVLLVAQVALGHRCGRARAPRPQPWRPRRAPSRPSRAICAEVSTRASCIAWCSLSISPSSTGSTPRL